jgi:hypothetical protein
MEALGIAAFSVSSILCLVVASRLLWIASRSRETSELAIGLVMVFEFVSAASWAVAASSAAGQMVSTFAAAASVSTLGFFVFHTFTSHSIASSIALAGLWLAAAACVLAPSLVSGWGSEIFYEEFGWGASLVRTVSYGCAAFVAARSQNALRRRARLGLSHPLTASRVGFWAISSGCACISYLIPIVRLAAGLGEAGTISPLSMGLAICASFFMWLAFYPPKAYQAWALERLGHT